MNQFIIDNLSTCAIDVTYVYSSKCSNSNNFYQQYASLHSFLSLSICLQLQKKRKSFVTWYSESRRSRRHESQHETEYGCL